MKKNLFPLLGIALAVAILATLLFYGLFLSRLPSGTPAGAGHPVVVAAHSLDRGATLVAADVKVVAWGSPDQIKGSFSAPEQVVGLSVVQPIGENEPITESRLASRTSGSGAGLGVPAGMRAISVHVVDSTGVVTLLHPGHKVDVQVVGALSHAASEDLRLKTILQHMEVLSVSPQSDPNGGKAGGQVLTLLATPPEADLLALADSAARLRVTLRNPLDDQRRQPPVLVQASLFDRGAASPAPVAAPVRATAPASPSTTRIAFHVQMAAAGPAAVKELTSHLDAPLRAGTLQVLPFRHGSDIDNAVRSLHARDLLDLLPPSNLTAGYRGEVSVHNGLDGANACRLSIRVLSTPLGGTGLRLRVQPEVVSSPNGVTRGIDTEVEVHDGQSLLVAGLGDPHEQLELMKRLFPARVAGRQGWDLLILVRPQIVKPLQSAALSAGR
jgi:pilus assembly protein CpaB